MRAGALVLGMGVAVACVVAGCVGGPDDGNTDAAPDAAPDTGPDAGPCGGCEAGQVCDDSAVPPACVECVGDDDCADPTPVCDTETNACVGCLDNAGCTDPAASRCDGTEHACMPCERPDDCSHLDGLSVCDTSGEAWECVECTPATEETACGAKSCNPAKNQCGPHDRGSQRACESCVSDRDCEANHRCVPMEFAGTDREDAYCLQVFPSEAGDPSCSEPFSVETPARMSLSGVESETYCGINEDLAACEAVRALLDNWRCDGTDGMCKPTDGEPEVEVPSALCENVGGLGMRCTYRCSGASDCKSSGAGSTCDDGGTGGDNYCGG